MTNKNTCLFYDLETTGLDGSFNQVLRFASIRTDIELNELDRSEINIRLRPDIIPSPKALITNRLSLNDILIGESEYDAIFKIYKMFNEPNTISVGYNSLSFDNEFLRYSFYRNLFDPYQHEWKDGCGKMDILPITLYFYLFKPDAIKWPGNDIDNKLKLEHISAVNNLAEGMAHDAMVDVESTVELARKLKNYDEQLWYELTSSFNKNEDKFKLQKLPNFEINPTIKYQIGAMTSIKFGYNLNCIAPVICLGDHIHYRNQQCWLRLDKFDFNTITNKDDLEKLSSSLINRKISQPKFIVPIDESIKLHIGTERTEIVRKNLDWIMKNNNLLSIFSDEKRNYTYPERENLDVDASLYQEDFLTTEEKQNCLGFHKLSSEGKISLINKLPAGRIRELAIRVIGRNFPDLLNTKLKHEIEISFGDGEKVNIKGEKRTSINLLFKEINKEKSNVELDSQQRQILIALEDYYTKQNEQV